MFKNKLWNDIKNDLSIELLEHPIYNSFVSKGVFEMEFKPLLDLLDGTTMTDYIDIFYEKDSILTTSLRFIGENEKLDFYEWAVELECLPTLIEIHEGESTNDKNNRKEDEKNIRLEHNKQAKEIQLQKQKKNKDKELVTLYSIKNNIQKLLISNVIKQDKINIAKKLLKTKYEIYKETKGIIEEIETLINSFNL